MQVQANSYLIKKRQVLDKILEVTERQLRFILKDQLKGLKRVIGEREQLISELLDIDEHLKKDISWQENLIVMPLLRSIKEKEDEILAVSSQVLRAAREEQNNTKAKLQQFRLMRNMKNCYTRTVSDIYGNIINVKS